MADSSREELKRRIRERTRETQDRVSDPAFLSREREQKRDRIREAVCIFALALAFLLAGVFYLNNYVYTTYSLDRETEITGISGGTLYRTEQGEVLITRDSVFYLEEGEIRWTDAVTLGDPILRYEGDYFTFCDRDGYRLYICDRTGLLSTVRLSRKIEGMDISASGVVALFTESDDASYVSYFDRYGNRISVEVKSLLEQSGYPMALSLSPDGQRLAVVYYSIANGIGGSRLVLYDFEKGSAEKDYVIASMEDFSGEDVFLSDCRFLTDEALIAVGDTKLYFLKIGNEKTETREAELSEKAESLFFTEDGPGITEDQGDTARVLIYDREGNVKNDFTVPGGYEKLVVGEKKILFLSGQDVRIYNLSGSFRYSGTLVKSPKNAVFTARGSILLQQDSALQKITMK